MANAQRDENRVTTLLAVSSVDGVTPVPVYADPVTHRLLVDNAGGGTGTVTEVSVVSANGFAGSVADPTTTPAITLTTTVTGILKGNGTAMSAAVAGTDYYAPGGTDVALADGGTGASLADPGADRILFWDDSAGAVTWLTAGAGLTITDTTISASGTPLTLETDGVANGDQTLLNLIAGTNITLTDDGLGGVTIDAAGGGASGITVGTTTITSGTNTRVLYNNSGVVGEYTISGSGNVAMTTSAALTTPTVATSITPAVSDAATLGTAALQFSDLYLAEGGVINWDNGDMTLTQTSNVLQVAGGDLRMGGGASFIVQNASGNAEAYIFNNGGSGANAVTITAFGTADLVVSDSAVTTTGSLVSNGVLSALSTIELGHASDTTLARHSAGQLSVEGVQVVTLSNTITLTNKRVTPRVGTVASSATPTINTDDVDAFSITALATDITSMTTNLSGTPTDFQKLIIRIKDDGTARGITWGASFAAMGVDLPTTTVISKVLTVGFIYDSVAAVWGCVASAQEA